MGTNESKVIMADSDFQFHYHHVGGRGGSLPFEEGPMRVPRQFYQDIQLHLYDADPECEQQLAGKGFACPTQVHTKALWREQAIKTLYVYYDPHASSFLRANPAYAKHYRWQTQCGDFELGTMLRPVKHLAMPVESMDAHVAQSKVLVDFLSLDTQGAELDILKGALRTCSDSVVGVMAEISLGALYEGQGLFPALLEHLQGLQFSLVTVQWNELGSYRAPLGFRSKSCPVDGDAYFIKDAQAVLYHPQPYRDLMKLAFLALTLGLLERCIEALELTKDLRTDFTGPMPAYMGMLQEMLRIFEGSPKAFPVSLQDFYGQPHEQVRLTIEVIRQRYFSAMPVEWRKQQLVTLITLASVPQTALEQHLELHGFSTLAQAVRERRVKESLHTLQYIGVQIGQQDGQVFYSSAVEAEILAIPYLGSGARA
jgi:FkbM family methyltransferase